MNSKFSSFIKNSSYTLTSNFISFLISSLVVLIVPKLVGAQEYGYFQLYMFYISYVGFLHFGWQDGIALRYSGKNYADLDKKSFYSQFILLICFQTFIALIIFVFALPNWGTDGSFIFITTAICTILLNLRTYLSNILLCTSRIKKYSVTIIIGRIFYCLLIVAMLFMHNRDYKLLVIADLAGRILALGVSIFFCRDIVFRKLSDFTFEIKEIFKNINVGIKIMFASISDLLIVGVIRFGIERMWNVSTFGKISLTLNISNMMMIFISAVGVVMLPTLRKIKQSKLPALYKMFRNPLMALLLFVLLLYYPIKIILVAWLPKYADTLRFMAILFPICIFEGKMQLLINTYLKTIRREKTILRISSTILVLSVIVTLITAVILKNFDVVVVSIVFILALKCIYAETILSKIIGVKVKKDIILEVCMVAIFMISGWYMEIQFALPTYVIAYVIYLLIKRKDLMITFKGIKNISKI